MPDPIQLSARGIDLSTRFAQSTTVAASPALAAETTIATLTIPLGLTITSGVWLTAWAAFTVGTSGVSARLRLRQTSSAGTLIADSGATTAGISATNLATLDAQGFDTAPPAAGVYVVTLTIGSGAAASTVSAVQLTALAI